MCGRTVVFPNRHCAQIVLLFSSHGGYLPPPPPPPPHLQQELTTHGVNRHCVAFVVVQLHLESAHDLAVPSPILILPSPPLPLRGICFYVTALGFSMMATVMTVNPLGNDLSSCLHSSCTAPPCPGGHAAVDSTSPASWSKCRTPHTAAFLPYGVKFTLLMF